MPNVVWSVEMRNVLKIALFVHREPLTITLSVEGCTDLKNFHARDKVLHTGRRDDASFNPVIIPNSATDSCYNVMDPVKLALITALRTGATVATTIDELMEQTLARSDRTVQWARPERPVLWRGLVVERPALVTQLNNTLKAAARAIGVTVKVTAHDLRRGAAQDTARLATPTGIESAAAVLYHKPGSIASGVTQRYVGTIGPTNWEKRTELEDDQDFSLLTNGKRQMFALKLAPEKCKNEFEDMTVSTESSDPYNSQGMLVSIRKQFCILTGSVKLGVIDVIEEAYPDFKVNEGHEARVKSIFHDLREKASSGETVSSGETMDYDEAHKANNPERSRRQLPTKLYCRDDPSQNTVVTLESSDTGCYNVMDPATLAIVMALRIGATAATSIEDLVEATIARPDRTMQWAFPERPVPCCIENGQDRHLVLDEPAYATQFNNTLKAAAARTGVTVKITPHDMKRRTAQEAAALNKATGIDSAAQVLGHRPTTTTTGFTQKYAGDIRAVD
ncbi:hypothetical protein D6D19_01463 [Aureobasidium pullulans]|uniref:Uncharacterized protein n=1 Tax=Aureobasidium pullulans TaxID=5580 RepID=A0A4S9AHL8_AURPU|nr:hypothetical protein D6D19_01463 [Aureobasidium pullulans]